MSTSHQAEGLDFSVLNALYLHHYDSLPLKKSSIMTETAQVFSFNFYQSSSVQSETKDMLLKVTKSGTCACARNRKYVHICMFL